MKKNYSQPTSRVIELMERSSILSASTKELYETGGTGTTLTRRRTWLDDEEE